MTNQLFLKGLNGQYIKTNRNTRKEIYHDYQSGNTIIFTPYDESVNTESICNGIRNSAYEYLINVLNTNNNITVHWSQIEGTTSDYDIYYDLRLEGLELKSYDAAMNVLNNVADGNCSMKYNEIKDGKVYPIKCV